MAEGHSRGATEIQIDQIASDVREIKEHLRTLNGRVGRLENFQAVSEATTDNTQERLGDVEDKSDAHEAFINKLTGGRAAVIQLIATLASCAGILGMVISNWLSSAPGPHKPG